MPTAENIDKWTKEIRGRYERYLKTSFYFKDTDLRKSFADELGQYDLMKDSSIEEASANFVLGPTAKKLAREYFGDQCEGLLPALMDERLYAHQEQAIRAVFKEGRNVVVATGTASGKTESFLYPILFELYRQHLAKNLAKPGVRALILYPMNALANDQRERLGKICKRLYDQKSDFAPTFGQYIGTTPEHKNNKNQEEEQQRLPGESLYRKEMRENPPHILLTNYSMLEYLLIRPKDSQLFDNGRGKFWQFFVLDEAHQYRGVKGMEVGMLIRRLKQRLRSGGRADGDFRCIATSATLSSDEKNPETDISNFARNLFDATYNLKDVILGDKREIKGSVRRYHVFMRALEGAFLVHRDGKDKIVLNREQKEGEKSKSFEIALCRDCGQHYYVGHNKDGVLEEAKRYPGNKVYVEFYLPTEEYSDNNNDSWFCRICGQISDTKCSHGASIKVRKCEPNTKEPDQLKECPACDYTRGSMGDPVHEIVHGADGPNTVIATALHSLLPKEEGRRKILSFADSRRDAAFFAWYAEHTYKNIRNRNLILRAFRQHKVHDEGLSVMDLMSRIKKLPAMSELFSEKDTDESKNRRVLDIIFRELVTTERRMALSGVGLVKWAVKIPEAMEFPPEIFDSPWGLAPSEAQELLSFLLNDLRLRSILSIPDTPDSPDFNRNTINVERWKHANTARVKFMTKLLEGTGLPEKDKRDQAKQLMQKLWRAMRNYDKANPGYKILESAESSGYYLNYELLRAQSPMKVYECEVCANISTHNIGHICPRWRCGKKLIPIKPTKLENNHYRMLYEDGAMPMKFRSEEHTAQIASEKAQDLQKDFKRGEIDLLSTSTTFEVGVDLGDLESVFLRNVPPEPFNYTQRVGRTGRRDMPGLALTYCRRNPHDLYHYQNPQITLLKGETRAPKLRFKNKKIILRHMTAVALSAFFNQYESRFSNVESFIGGNWDAPNATTEFINFCHKNHEKIQQALESIVPIDMREEMGLMNGSDNWIILIAGAEDNRGERCLRNAEKEVREDYLRVEEARIRFSDNKEYDEAKHAEKRASTIKSERILNFLSRKAVIPKYGFPVDVVELDVSMSGDNSVKNVSLQRDLSQAIAEYAPGSKIIAYKKQWESCGFKIVKGKEPRVVHYRYDELSQTFDSRESPPPEEERLFRKKYLCPQFGFVTEFANRPKDPSGRPRSLYTTRPFFSGFDYQSELQKLEAIALPGVRDVNITKALPGKMVVLCEGKNGRGFHLCRKCGMGFPGRRNSHTTPYKGPCDGMLECLSLGHEFPTDIVQMDVLGLEKKWDAYSFAYALLLGAARSLDVPDGDLNVTIKGVESRNEYAIILYDNVPGGAGLVDDLTNTSRMADALNRARERVRGACGCDESCYGCLRSYRNQFAHPYLQRKDALRILDRILGSTEE